MCSTPPRKVAPPVIAPRRKGWPRPVSSPESESPSLKPIEIPAPTAAAIPTTKVVCGLWVAKATAKIGARVETEPSISPASAGWTTRSTSACSSSAAGTSPINTLVSHRLKDEPAGAGARLVRAASCACSRKLVPSAMVTSDVSGQDSDQPVGGGGRIGATCERS